MHAAISGLLDRVFGICPTGAPHEVMQLFDVPEEGTDETIDLLQSLVFTALEYEDVEQMLIQIRARYGVETALESAVIAATSAWSIADQAIDEEQLPISPIVSGKFWGKMSQVQGRGLKYALAATLYGVQSSCWPLEEGGAAGWQDSVAENATRLLEHVLEHCPTGSAEEMDASMCFCPGTSQPSLVSLAVFAVHAGREQDIEDMIRAKYGANTALETRLKEMMQGVSSAIDLVRQADQLKKREEQKSEDKNKRVVHIDNGRWSEPGPLCYQTQGKIAHRISSSERWCYKCRDLVDGFQKALQGDNA